MIVKICGVKRYEDLRAIAREEVDMVGFIYGFEGRPRSLGLREVVELVTRTPENLRPVVVTRSDQGLVDDLLSECTPFALQLYGDRVMRAKGVKVILPVAVDKRPSLESIKLSRDLPDYILLESGEPGSGRTIDWELARSAREALGDRKAILSGGLRPENVCEAIRIVRPDGVDTSSGVERSVGVKDVERIKAFVKAARGCIGSL
ncbi:MAG: phosphoribosylanthranilate isomerase [Aigarchaeota archaeon]|nr:phosphoribosylanthranilate isomerase [Aigarchaeota archaeon]MDW8092522.1 phosphoribosylanthranilate isomerase [Nitrososphaerota archaeon]